MVCPFTPDRNSDDCVKRIAVGRTTFSAGTLPLIHIWKT
jgi:hypothetical protein